jgi:cyclopropane-fatty-acyl-phospholipid synthase
MSNSLGIHALTLRSEPWGASRYKRAVEATLAQAGVTIGASGRCDIRVHDERAYAAFLQGSMGVGEAYMDGHWSAEHLDHLMARLFAAGLQADPPGIGTFAREVLAKVVNFQSRARAFRVAEVHYDAGNDLFERMLDAEMVYTCAYWSEGDTLESAQRAKLDLVCRKLGLAPGMRVLDIGCGFGAFMKYACEHYGVTCVGYSVSAQQTALARARCAGLPVEIVLEDYRAIPRRGRTFDRVVSIGMLEAVGVQNYRTFMQVVHDVLRPDGVALVHTVGSNLSTQHGDPWIDRYIFPNGMLPSIAQLGAATEGLLVMEDWHNFGPHYDKTLLAWNERFQAAWPELKSSYTERFKRMWELYLLAFAGAFRARSYQLWQLVLTRPGRPQPLCRVS